MKKAVVFGIGTNFLLSEANISKEYDIICLVDNATQKHGKVINGRIVHLPEKIFELQYDVILITPSEPIGKEIYEQLLNMGIVAEKIEHLLIPKISPMLIDPEFFSILNYEQKKKLFAENVELVYIEPHSQCNRKCWFCPNSKIDRHSRLDMMENDIFIKVLTELAEIDYDGDLSFSLYNEPLMDKNICSKIKVVREMLPNVMIHFNTNGDFLTNEILGKLEKAGLDRILISHYVDSNINNLWTYDKAFNSIVKMCDALRLSQPSFWTSDNDFHCMATVELGNLNIMHHTFNMRKFACDRGGTLSEKPELTKIEKRTKFCVVPYLSFIINYKGTVYPCANFHPESPEHQKLIVGDVKKESIFEIFAGEKFTEFRKKMIMDINTPPCNSCNACPMTGTINTPNKPLRDRPRYRKLAREGKLI